MKIEMQHKMKPRRGGEVKVGNVYINAHGKNIYKIVVGITDQKKGHGYWNNVICIHIDTMGNIVGCSRNPMTYIAEHQDWVGIVRNPPTMRVEWFGKE